MHGDASPSPFGPLLALWLRGAWPAMLPGDEALVYVPIVHEGRVVPWLEGDPLDVRAEHPKLVRHGPRRRPIAAERSEAPPAWWTLGLSFPLTFEVKRYPMVTLGVPMSIGPDARSNGDDSE